MVALQVPKPNAAELGIILNSLAGLGYKKSDLPALDIQNLVRVFNAEEDVSGKNMLSILGGCSRLSYDKDELGFDDKKLSGIISIEFAALNSSQKIHLLNSLAKIGYDKNNPTLSPAILKTFNRVKREVQILDGKDIAVLVHSMAKMEIYDELFAAREEITAGLTSQKVSDLSSQAAFSILQAEMFCRAEYKQEFFGSEIQESVARKYERKVEPISKLQKSIIASLEKNGFTIIPEKSVFEVSGVSVRDVDIVATKRINEELKTFYFEVDGTSHYLGTSHETDSATKRRDRLNREAISSRVDSINKSYYLTLPYYEIESNQNLLKEYLLEKMQQAQEIESRFYLESLSAGIADLRIAEVPDEMTLTVDAIELTSISKKSKKKKSKPKTEHVFTSVAEEEEIELSPLEKALRVNNIREIERAICIGEDVNQILSSGRKAFDDVLQRNFENKRFPNPVLSKILNLLINAGVEVADSEILTSEDPEIRQKLSKLSRHAQLRGYESLSCTLIAIDSTTIKSDELTTAVQSNSLQIVDALIASGRFDPNSQDAEAAISLAAENVMAGKSDIKILASLMNKAHINSNLIRDKSELVMQELLTRSLEDNCDEIFIPLVEQNRLSREFLFGREPQKTNFSLLHCAAMHGSATVTRFLTDTTNSCAVPADRIVGVRTPLMVAIDSKKIEIVKILVDERGVRPDQLSSIGINPITRAAHVGDCEMIDYLMSRGAEINFSMDPKIFRRQFSSFLESNGIGVSTIPNTIISATIAGHSEIIPFLVEKGADLEMVNHVDGTRTSLVNSAVSKRDVSYLSGLIDGGLDVVSKQNLGGKLVAPLEFATDLSTTPGYDFEVVKLLLRNGADPNGKSLDDYTIFHSALMIPNISIRVIKAMIEIGGADCRGETKETLLAGRNTPIQQFAGKANPSPLDIAIMGLLIDGGANPNQQMNNGLTLACWAAINGNLRMLQLLERKGADVTSKQGFEKRTPMEYAIEQEKREIVEYLEKVTAILPEEPSAVATVRNRTTNSLKTTTEAKNNEGKFFS